MTEERMKYYFQDSKGQTWEEFKENMLEPDESYEECYRKISRVLINYGSHEMTPWEYFKEVYQDIPKVHRIPLMLETMELPDLRWHDLRATASTTLLVAGFSPEAVSKLMGHSKEILCVDTYGDGRKLAAIKLDKLDSFIESVISVETNENENVIGLCKIVVDEYLPIVAQYEQTF